MRVTLLPCTSFCARLPFGLVPRHCIRVQTGARVESRALLSATLATDAATLFDFYAPFLAPEPLAMRRTRHASW